MVIPDEIASSLVLGRSKTMLICFDKAERHLPDRCMKQYGMPHQPIPEPVDRWERKSRGVDGGVDLSGKMESELKEWSERHLQIIHSGEDADDSKYMHWYLRITRRFVGRPIPLASEFQRMVIFFLFFCSFYMICQLNFVLRGALLMICAKIFLLSVIRHVIERRLI